MSQLPNGRRPDVRNVVADDPAALRARIEELERLCAEVYMAAVELGLPRGLLNRLWTVAANGSSPAAFDIEMPPRPPAPAPAPAEPMPVPDIRLTDRPRNEPSDDRKVVVPELAPVSERRTVLVVDDDAMMMEVLVRILQRENFELLTATNGPEALRVADAHGQPIHLLVTDYAMPDMKGRELADKMRERYPAIAVLYQTGFSDMLFEDRLELEEGAAFLEKPFTARGLREAARMILFGAVNPVAVPVAQTR